MNDAIKQMVVEHFDDCTYHINRDETENYLDELVFDNFSVRCALLAPGEITDCKGLVEPDLWDDIVPSERRHVFGCSLSRYVDLGLLPLEFVGFNKQRHNLYRKVSR